LKKFFIGIDVSKKRIDVAYRNGSGVVYLGHFENNQAGFKTMIEQLKQLTTRRKNSWFFCFENTGVYSKILLGYLCSRGYACREENPLHLSKSLGIKRAKKDDIDARDICQYAYEKRDSIEATEPLADQLTRLRKVLSYRDLSVRKKVSMEVALKDQKDVMNADLYDELNTINQNIIESHKAAIKKADDLIEQIIAEQEHTATNHYLAQTVIGIGPVISAYIIAYTNNYECFINARTFACFCAIAPFPFQSGTSIKKKNTSSYFGHKKLKSLLSNGALAAIQFDKELGLYYEKKIAAGKKPGIAINNVKNKLLHRVFAVVKRGTSFVRLNRHVNKPIKKQLSTIIH